MKTLFVGNVSLSILPDSFFLFIDTTPPPPYSSLYKATFYYSNPCVFLLLAVLQVSICSHFFNFSFPSTSNGRI
ncbi:hypothetical protein EDB19DRAFT_1744433 [Suillus lakei]|nr:hypothetical protein EDB19DRAFT_1744433 [Suillus lakei]